MFKPAQMTLYTLFMVGSLLGSFWLQLPTIAQGVEHSDEELVIGVIAHRGIDKALARWSATADYLSKNLDGYTFRILPLPVSGLAAAEAEGSVNFFILNPGAYVELADAYGISSLSTLRTRWGADGADTFGSVVFSSASREDLRNFGDLKNKRFVAVAPESFGGFQTTWREFQDAGIDIDTYFSAFDFTGFPQDSVVKAVLAGKYDAGTVRTGILEKMVLEGELQLDDIKVIGPVDHPDFPLLLSSRSYPEWAFARTPETSSAIARDVLRALLNLPQDHPAAVTGGYVGWSTPASYSEVRSLFRELRIGPYEGTGEISLSVLWREYSEWILLISLAVTLLVINNIVVRRAVTARKQSQMALEARSAELRKSNEALDVARKKADQSNQAKSEFLSRMSHELRTPMNSIIGFTGIIKDGIAGPINEEQAKQLNMVYNSARHLLSLINDVLDISRVEAGKLEAAEDEFDLPALLQDVYDLIKTQADAKGLEFVANFDKAPSRLYSDKARLRQILINLLGNSVKFTSEGRIKLRCEIVDESVVIEVEDTGVGIEYAEQEDIFEAFHQIEGGDERQQEGSGLGLAITSQLIELLGCEIKVQSVPGEGSTFSVRLPADKIRAQHSITNISSAKGRMREHRKSNSRTVLAIDDQKDALELLKTYLLQEDYNVVLCEDASEAVALAKTHQPLAITLDVLMPDPDGWNTMTALKNDPETASIPIIMISSMDEKNLGLSLGALDYLQKPVEAAELLSCLEKLNLTGSNVLVIDDRPQDSEMLRAMLAPEDYQITICQDGPNGLLTLENNTFDLILLDLMMPGMSGFEFIRRLRGGDYPGGSDTPIIVVSAKSLTNAETTFLNSTVENILVKGQFGREEMLTEIGKTLARITNKTETERIAQ